MISNVGINANIPTPPLSERHSKAFIGDLRGFEGDVVSDYPDLFGSGAGGFSDCEAGGLTLILEQVAGKTCRTVPIMVGKNEVGGAAVLFRPRCKMWSCPHCAFINQYNWMRRAKIGAQHFIDQGDTVCLVTITSHEKVSANVAIDRLPDNWNRLRNRWQREVSKPAYFMVGETGNETNHFHLHLITNKSPGERFWKDAARKSGMGYIANESDPLVDAYRAARYTGKYLSKQLTHGVYKRGYHRVRPSQNWPKLPEVSRDALWEFSILAKTESISNTVDDLRGQGFRVALADHKTAWTVVNAV